MHLSSTASAIINLNVKKMNGDLCNVNADVDSSAFYCNTGWHYVIQPSILLIILRNLCMFVHSHLFQALLQTWACFNDLFSAAAVLPRAGCCRLHRGIHTVPSCYGSRVVEVELPGEIKTLKNFILWFDSMCIYVPVHFEMLPHNCPVLRATCPVAFQDVSQVAWFRQTAMFVCLCLSDHLSPLLGSYVFWSIT